ncbi:MAG: retropepsin-like aspartic protease family protein [Sphingopyxis sp.]|jgi:aspartyl protease family protein|uniref:retropepsin-like aspartic protease family protein n=1 Tax=unclassified Sphingopyxis TaxID=2614943 RepID=UPI0007307D8D|nr:MULTISPECIES: TIGR02281 family clan AA aspartic protease [unclassified Sphingopyxis]KTE03265.1 aspartyl protease [Sphingopyxis sp. H012]KTE05542.1 aspartyl protease [Sphingopyxis sp. H053]KTE06103.1 aspartyl protease [Sphingopyxis sp. H093]KTE24607.1 aspartyl protease [Sphingopyxis sp. H080]KTE36246.1 aspartyl protease [Sphingopyxis sp. H038]
MLGRFLGLAAVIAAVSVGLAGVASRSSSNDAVETSNAISGNHDNWTTHKVRKDRSLAAAEASGHSGRPSEVLLARSGDSHFYADTEIDGRNIRMLVDSGASIVALTRSDAEAIGINVDDLPVGGSANTAGGVVPMRMVTLDSVEVEGIEVRGVQAAVIDADMGVSLLGQSFLSKLAAVNVEGDTMTLR